MLRKKTILAVVVTLFITLLVAGGLISRFDRSARPSQSANTSKKSVSNVSSSKFINNPDGNHFIDLYNQIYTSGKKEQVNSKKDFTEARWQAIDLTSIETMSQSEAAVFFYDSWLIIWPPNQTETAGFDILKIKPIKNKSGISGYELEIQPMPEPGGDFFTTYRIEFIDDAYHAVKLVDPDNILKLGQVTLLYETKLKSSSSDFATGKS